MFGTFVILPVSGLLIASYGWESVFYFSGLSTMIWGILWLTLVHDDPRNHPWVSDEELRHILGPNKYAQHKANVRLLDDGSSRAAEETNVSWKNRKVHKQELLSRVICFSCNVTFIVSVKFYVDRWTQLRFIVPIVPLHGIMFNMGVLSSFPSRPCSPFPGEPCPRVSQSGR